MVKSGWIIVGIIFLFFIVVSACQQSKEIVELKDEINTVPKVVVDCGNGVTANSLENCPKVTKVQEPVLKGPQLVIVDTNNRMDSGYDHIFGRVKNEGDVAATFVKVYLTLFDENGKVVGVDTTYTGPSDIAPGDTVQFEFMSQYPHFARYEVKVYP